MSTGAGIAVVQPTIAAHAALGAAQTACVAAATTLVAVAAGAAVTAAVGAGASWAVTQGLRTGSALAGRAADRCERALAEVKQWEGLVGEVAQRNADLGAVLGALARDGRAAVAARAPELMVLTDQTPDAVRDWCRQVDSVLGGLQRQLADGRSRAMMQRWEAAVAAALSTATVSDPATGPAGAGPAPLSGHEALVERVRELLGRAPMEASDAERDVVSRAAGAALDAPGWEIEIRLKDLKARVQDASDAVRRRRAQAREAAVLVQPLLPDDPASPLRGTVAEVRGRLLDVVAGRLELDDELRVRALAAIDERVAAALQEHLETSLREELRELGHDGADLQVVRAEDGRLAIRMAGDSDHELRVGLREDPSRAGGAGLTWVTVRTGAPDIDPAGAAEAPDPAESDEAACEQACAVLDRLTDRLRGAGVDTVQRRRRGPGGPVPVAAPLPGVTVVGPAPSAEAAQLEANEKARRDEERRRRGAAQAKERVRKPEGR